MVHSRSSRLIASLSIMKIHIEHIYKNQRLAALPYLYIFMLCNYVNVSLHPEMSQNLILLMKTLLSVCYQFLLWPCLAASCSAGPGKTVPTSPNCMAMKPYHSVQISILLTGEILFQAITLHQEGVILALCSYCPPWPMSLPVPLGQWHYQVMYKLQ